MRFNGQPSRAVLFALIDERERHHKELIVRLEREFHEHIAAALQETRFALNASDKAITKAEIATEKAIDKASAATETRFKSVNEFRSQLSDQANTFMPRNEALAAIHRNTERIGELNDRLTTMEGKSSGLNAGWVYLLGSVAAIGTVASFIIAFTR